MNCVKGLFLHYGKRSTFNLGNHLNKLCVMADESFKVTLQSDMEDLYNPPKLIRGMKVLDKNSIKKTIIVSSLVVENTSLNYVIKIAKNYLLKIQNIKTIQEIEGNKQRILINTKKIKTWSDLDETTVENFKKVNVTEENFMKVPLELKYENWLHHELLKAILPENEPPLTSFSIIGHIIHLNIKDHLLDYKNVIGEILLDKIPQARTVIYKESKIDNVYRNFEMRLLCGEPEFIASVKENNCNYELDFSKVYWNPRLSTEHSRIANLILSGDVLFDVFAGVGPFAIPVAKKRCMVFANDLNPESVKWLRHNITLNKKSKEFIQVYNQDGADFIRNVIKENLVKIYKDEYFINKIHIVMNLPAIAPTFVKHFKGLISVSDVECCVEKIKNCLPIVHCYFFTANANCLKNEFEENSGLCLNNVEHSFHFIRKVSNSKSMYRITFTLPIDYLLSQTENNESGEPLSKRICTSQSDCK